MRLFSRARLCALALLLSGCLAPALLLPSQTDLMLALLKPLVGFDPNATNLFEQPLIKNRMITLFGSHYDTAMKLLRTADELQREGPLFFVVSRYTPVPQLAQKAGLVWNSDTNQMAAVLLKGDVTQVVSEVVEQRVEAVENKVEQKVEAAENAVKQRAEEAEAGVRAEVEQRVDTGVRKVLPTWPGAMQGWLHPQRALQGAVQSAVDDAANRAVGAAVDAVAPPEPIEEAPSAGQSPQPATQSDGATPPSAEPVEVPQP